MNLVNNQEKFWRHMMSIKDLIEEYTDKLCVQTESKEFEEEIFEILKSFAYRVETFALTDNIEEMED